MRKFIKSFMMLVCMLHFGVAAYAADNGNELSLGLVADLFEKDITIPVMLTNQAGISSLQFDVLLPEGMTLNGDASAAITMTERATTHSLTVTKLKSGKIRVLIYSASNTAFTGTSGAIVNISLTKVGTSGSYPIAISNVVLSDAAEREYECPDTSFPFLICKTDDPNGDGRADLQDVSSLVTAVSTGNISSSETDVNGDGRTDIQDIVAMVALLNK